MAKLKIVDRHGAPYSAGPSYEGAGHRAKELRNWNPVQASADADLYGEHGDLVSRSRDLVRNNGWASGAEQTLVDNVVGTGLRLQAKPDYRMLGWTKDQADEWSAQVERLWRTFAETTEIDATGQLDFHAMTQLVYRCRLYNGEGLAIGRWLNREPFRGWATAIQLVDPDRLSNPNSMMDTRNLRQGVEINNDGRVRRYHIRESHPIDVPMSPMSASWRAIPARTRNGRQRVIHAYERERVGQHRGVPVFAPILSNFRMLDRYEGNELRSSVVNSLIAAFIETSASSDQLAESFGLSFEEYANKRGQWGGQLEGGGMYQLPPGDRINSFNPDRPNNVFGDFEQAVLRQLSTGLNLPYELLAKDYSQTNYSSARAALLEAWRYFSGRRRWLATYWAQPVYEMWLEEAVNRGLVSAPGFYENRYAYTRTRWVGPGRGWIDPVKEAQAARIRIETGLTTLEDEAAEQGADWEDVLEQQAREEQRRRDLGLAPGPTSSEIAAGAASVGADRDNDTGQRPAEKT